MEPLMSELIERMKAVLSSAGLLREGFAGEVQLLEWSKSTSRDGPKMKLMFPDDEDVAPFEAATVRKGKQAGQIYYAFMIRIDEDARPLENDPNQEDEESPNEKHGPYGASARALKLSGFFRNPKVWAALGSDDSFLDWVRRRPSCISGEFSEFVDGDGRCVAAHVRRVASGSGKAIKGKYSAVPMTDSEHKLQHNEGELSAYNLHLKTKGQRAAKTAPEAKAWFDEQRMLYVEDWAWERFREALGVKSMSHASPKAIVDWAADRIPHAMVPAGIRSQVEIE